MEAIAQACPFCSGNALVVYRTKKTGEVRIAQLRPARDKKPLKQPPLTIKLKVPHSKPPAKGTIPDSIITTLIQGPSSGLTLKEMRLFPALKYEYEHSVSSALTGLEKRKIIKGTDTDPRRWTLA